MLCTDIFDEFMDTNGLYQVALSDADDDTILKAFLRAKLPDRLVEIILLAVQNLILLKLILKY